MHRLALAAPFVAQASHDLEKLLTRRMDSGADGKHVFVSGLARAGTTILMRSLYRSGRFRSLTYRDMPFVLMPKTWSGISSLFRRHEAEKERAHGDRVMVNFDSPEAFEEVFWRSFCGEDYISEESLRPHQPAAETLEEFRQFIANILACDVRPGQTRYLSKNNNNLLRLPAIAEAFPEAAILIPFRSPLEHAFSLKKQHELFLGVHGQDPFARDYMDWLGHHEFGGNHRPFRFEGQEPIGVDKPQISDGETPGKQRSGEQKFGEQTPHDLNYWVERWSDAYAHLLASKPERALLVSYEKLCERPLPELARIFAHAELTPGDWSKDIVLRKSESHLNGEEERLAPAVRARAEDIYAELLRRC